MRLHHYVGSYLHANRRMQSLRFDLLQNRTVRNLVHAIGSNSRDFEAGGRVLRLKQYLGINVRPPVMDAILTALEKNTLVEALYIQNFEEVRGDSHARGAVHTKCQANWAQANKKKGQWSGLLMPCLTC